MVDVDAHTAWLASETDVSGFRAAARRLLAHKIEPQRVVWQISGAAEGDLFASIPTPLTPIPAGSALEHVPLRLPAVVVALNERAQLHRDPHRHDLLYLWLWRLAHEPGLCSDPLDPDRLQVELLARAVRRDMHKMTAFVRFRPLQGASTAETTIAHMAWFEPQHHIVEATAAFFVRRFAQMPWAILTPDRSARWDGRQLAFGPGARREDAPPADADERLWLTYYESIFNPARLKLAMMQKEMPRRYWKNLPEAALITTLAAQSAERSGRMIEQGASTPARRRPAASLALRLDQRVEVHTPEGRVDAPATLATLAELGDALQRCRTCPIGHAATQAVAGEGDPRAQLMLVGEQPGDQEDLHGRPFVGPAGQLLDRALAQLGWPREKLYLTNAVKHFKFELRGKRRMHKTAAQQEAAACLQWLEHEIALVAPQAVIALGVTAARALLGHTVNITSLRGQWARREDGLPVLVVGHPSALLRIDRSEFDAAFAAWTKDLRQAMRFGETGFVATAGGEPQGHP
jgi:probable DNA metabolism protein